MSALRDFYDRLPAELRGTIRRLAPKRTRRWYAHQKTEVYLISYPKCGRTWLRLMIGRAIAQYYALPDEEDILFLRWKSRPRPDLPMITVVHEDRPMLKAPDELQDSKKKFRDKKVIFLSRDPRDVIVSSYFEMKKRGDLFGDNPYESQKAVFEGNLSDFILRTRGGFDTILRYYNIWAENRNIPKEFLLVRYEDIKLDPERELCRVLDFLELQEINQQVVAEAVAYASFENMRKMEAEGRFLTSMLNPAQRSDQESYKTRKGKIGGFAEYLSEDEIQRLNQKMSDELSSFYGYGNIDQTSK